MVFPYLKGFLIIKCGFHIFFLDLFWCIFVFIYLVLNMLALRVTLRLREDKPSTHQSFWWMLVLYEWRSMDKTQNMNDVQHRTRQEMHREVRATLTSVSELSLIVSRGKT
jgi:hypothetical protein